MTKAQLKRLINEVINEMPRRIGEPPRPESSKTGKYFGGALVPGGQLADLRKMAADLRNELPNEFANSRPEMREEFYKKHKKFAEPLYQFLSDVKIMKDDKKDWKYEIEKLVSRGRGGSDGEGLLFLNHLYEKDKLEKEIELIKKALNIKSSTSSSSSSTSSSGPTSGEKPSSITEIKYMTKTQLKKLIREAINELEASGQLPQKPDQMRKFGPLDPIINNEAKTTQLKRMAADFYAFITDQSNLRTNHIDIQVDIGNKDNVVKINTNFYKVKYDLPKTFYAIGRYLGYDVKYGDEKYKFTLTNSKEVNMGNLKSNAEKFASSINVDSTKTTQLKEMIKCFINKKVKKDPL